MRRQHWMNGAFALLVLTAGCLGIVSSGPGDPDAAVQSPGSTLPLDSDAAVSGNGRGSSRYLDNDHLPATDDTPTDSASGADAAPADDPPTPDDCSGGPLAQPIAGCAPAMM